MQGSPDYRIRVIYSVLNRARFLSHKEMIKMLTRACRRADLPLKYSQGFHPRALLSFGPSRSVGLASTSEIMDIRLSEKLDPLKIKENLINYFTDDIKVLDVYEITENHSSIPEINSADYHCVLPYILESASEKISKIMKKTEIIINRSKENITKFINIRPGILNIFVNDNIVEMKLALTPELSVKPQEVLAELTNESIQKQKEITITRTALNPCT